MDEPPPKHASGQKSKKHGCPHTGRRAGPRAYPPRSPDPDQACDGDEERSEGRTEETRVDDWPHDVVLNPATYGRFAVSKRIELRLVLERLSQDACEKYCRREDCRQAEEENCPGHRAGGRELSGRFCPAIVTCVRRHRPAPTPLRVCPTLGISCEAVPPSIWPAGAQGGTSACRTGAALSFVGCIRLLDGARPAPHPIVPASRVGWQPIPGVAPRHRRPELA